MRFSIERLFRRIMPHWTQAIQRDPEALRTFTAELQQDLLDASVRQDKAVQNGELHAAATALGRKMMVAEIVERVERWERNQHAA